MAVTNVSTAPPQWSKAIAQPATEFEPTPLPVLSGAIPAGLRGTLYRNGPGRLTRGDRQVGHWFDGDGAILRVQFSDAGATGLYRYVQTAGYQAEERAGRFLYGNYGMNAPGPIWNHWRQWLVDGLPFKNAANTSVLALPTKLLALWEGGEPHALDLETLETLGLDKLGGLAPGQPYSAHPLRDPQTGEVFNIGVDPRSQLHIYRSDRAGRIVQQAAIQLAEVPFLHSFVMAGPYLICFIPPLRLNPLPVLLGFQTYSDALRWQPQRGTDILVVDRDTLTVVSRGTTDPWFQWHFGNGCVEADGSVTLDLVRFSDFPQTNEYLRQVATGLTHTPAVGTLWQLRLDPLTCKVLAMQEVVSRSGEFPVVAPHQVGQPWQHTYLAVHRAEAEIGRDWLGVIARFDYQTETLTEADLGSHRYPVEPIVAPDANEPERSWVLTVVYDGEADRSEVWVLDGDRLDAEPACRLELLQVVPFSFHGTWKPAR